MATDHADTAEGQVGRERIAAVYRQMPLTLGVSMAIALVTALVLAPRVAEDRLLAWLAAFAAMVAVRLLIWRRFLREPLANRAARRWVGIAIAGSVISGALWGACVALLMPAADPYPLFVAFVVAGMCAGAVTVNATHLPSVIGFILPAALPLAAWFVSRGGKLELAMALMTVVFAVSVVLAASRYSAQFGAGVRDRRALAERTGELAAANARLRAEIAERQQTEAALRQSQKLEAVGSLTAGVAHDFNNLLMVIHGAGELLQRQSDPAAPAQRQIGAILRAAERGGGLTRQLLAFARKETLNPELVDPNAVLRGTATMLAATLGKSVRIALELADPLRPVFVDRHEIERAIVNLAINARDAMPDGGTLTLRTDNVRLDAGAIDDLAAGPYAVISVADSGHGMPAEVLARAFDPFFTTKPIGEGSGLGLSQVYGLVRQSGGATRIDSATGQGTTVRLYLPVASAAALPPPGPAPPPPATIKAPPAGRHIVLLDDEALVREVVAELLEGAGYAVSQFGAADAALARIGTDLSVELLITDLGMPDRGGDEVARLARLARPLLPVLFITGYNEAGTLAGEKWQLRKPFGEAELLDMVASSLAARSAVA